MTNIMDFAGGFGDFETMFSDTCLDEYVIQFYYNDKNDIIDGEGYLKVVIGFTSLENGDVLLHLIDADCADSWDEIYENAEKYGVQFSLLSNIIKDHGFSIIPRQQPGETDDDDESEEDPWVCHCGNHNSPEDLFCLKCDCIEGGMDSDCEYKDAIDILEEIKKTAAILQEELLEMDPALKAMMKNELGLSFEDSGDFIKSLLDFTK